MSTRRWTVVVASVPAAALVLAPALAAWADGGATASGPTSVTSRDDTALGGTVSSPKGGTLTFAPSGGSAATADSRSSAGSLSCTLTAGSGGCGLSGPLRNGDYVLTVTSRAYTSTSSCGPAGMQTCTTSHPAGTDQRTVSLRVPPAAPAGVTARAAGRVVTVSWTANDEPDLLRYALFGPSGQLMSVSPTSASCGSGGCSVSVDYRGSSTSGDQSYTVRAYRDDGSGNALASAASAPATATLPPPPTTAPASTGGSGGGSSGGASSSGGTSTGGGTTARGGGAGGSATGPSGSAGSGGGAPAAGGGSVPAGATAPGQSAGQLPLGVSVTSRPGAGLRLPILPAQGPGVQPALPGAGREEPGPLGTYQPTLPYQDRVSLERYGTKGTATRFVQSVVSFTTDGHQLVRSLAGALALVLLGLHLRLLTRSTRYE